MTRLVSTAKGIGRLEDDGETVALLDLDAADLGAALQAGLDIASIATASVRDRVPVAQAQLIAPVPRPSKIWAVGYAYADHRTEVDYNGVAEEPVVFLKAPSSVIGTGGRIRFPKAAPDEVDYEGELAVVIGRRATDVSEAEAYAFVAGFTIVNDVSARDVQKGRVPGRAASYVSRQTTLEPGDVIATGTPAGVGHKEGRFLQSGTEVRIEIEGIGSLVNTCA
ncbi:fumarylacetoacetate hydrolase family protein [Streptomyces coeruleorubidus]|uniref:fumarylacetoacetate hydrolase family protein n=1 Tax=Streptomyces coeruleorubidus TaxID=116188 RepID=UPI0033FF7365